MLSRVDTTHGLTKDASERQFTHIVSFPCLEINLLGKNPLLKRPLALEDVKSRLLGHFGTTPGQVRHFASHLFALYFVIRTPCVVSHSCLSDPICIGQRPWDLL